MPDTSTVNYYDSSSIGTVTEADQSRLYYHRPLRDGDVITYEFLYEPGQVMVHPALDRLAFLLEPGGRQAPLDDLGRQRPLRPARRQRDRRARQPPRPGGRSRSSPASGTR